MATVVWGYTLPGRELPLPARCDPRLAEESLWPMCDPVCQISIASNGIEPRSAAQYHTILKLDHGQVSVFHVSTLAVRS
jgi:hypothetical protein